jgi:hypothetical protein
MARFCLEFHSSQPIDFSHDFFREEGVQAEIALIWFQAQTWPYGGWTLAKMSY